MTTIAELYRLYWPVVLAKVSPGTGRAYNAAWRARVAPSCASREVETLTTLDVELVFATWSGAWSTKIDALACLSALCRVAVKGGLTRVNPCASVDKPKHQDPDVAARALTLQEQQRLLDVLPTSGAYRRFVLGMLYTGARLGEVAGLYVSDVSWADRTISVSRSASGGLHGELVVGPTKGRRVRVVPMADPLVPIVAEAAQGKQVHDILFPGPRGGHLNSKNLSRGLGWSTIRDQVKTFPPGEEPLHWHDLRHTAAVNFFRAGLSAPDVQAILGHSSLAVTQLYADTRNEAAQRGAVALSAFLAQNRQGQKLGGENATKNGSDLGK